MEERVTRSESVCDGDLPETLSMLAVFFDMFGGFFLKPPNRSAFAIELSGEPRGESPEDDPLEQGLALMAGYWDGTSSDDLDLRLALDHARLFVGPHHLLAAPWSSVYSTGSLYGKATLELADFLKDHGLEITADDREPPDHIAYELACAAWLNRDFVEACSAHDKGHAKEILVDLAYFLEKFLLPWYENFLDAVETYATTSFYRGLGIATRQVIQQEYQAVHETLSGENR